MIAIAAVLSFQSVSFPTVPMTLAGPAMRLGNLVPILAEKSGAKFRISPEMANDVVFLKVDRLPMDRLAERVAQISLARWQPSSEGPILVRDATKLKAAQDAERLRRVEGFQRAQRQIGFRRGPAEKPAELLGALVKHLNSQDANTAEGFEKTQDFQRRMPMGDAARRIGASLSSGDIDAIFRNGRVVFAIKPNKMQRQMPDTAVNILNETWASLRAYGEALRKMPQEETQVLSNRGVINYLTGFTQQPPEMTGTWWVVGTVLGSSIYFNVEYRGSVGALQGAEMIAAFPDPGPGLASDDESPVSLRAESAALLEAYSKANAYNQAFVTMYVRDEKDPSKSYPLRYTYRRLLPNVPSIEPSLFQQILSPDRFDPFSYWVSDFLLQTANSKKKDTIAWLGDGLFTSTLGLFRGKPSLKNALSHPAITRNYEWGEAGGMMTFRPTFQATAIASRGDRAAFARAAQDLAKEGAVRERNLLAWAAAQTRQPTNEYEDYTIRLINPLGLPLSDMYRQWRGMGILGHLSESQRESLKAGQGVAFSTLSPALKARLEAWVFGSADPLFDLENWKPDESSGPRFSSLDPTFQFPNGVPLSAGLGLTYRTTPAFLARYPGGQLAEAETALQAASRLWVASKPAETGTVALPSPESYREGQERLFRLYFNLDSKWAMSQEFTVFEPTGATVKGFNGMPQAHRDEVNRILGIFNKNSGMGSGSGAPPP